MAYAPSLADLPQETAGYAPSLADLPPENSGIISSIATSAPVQGILGAGDALRNTLSGAANFAPNMMQSIVPGLNIPQGMMPNVNFQPVKSGAGTAYNVGNIAGNVAGFIGGGEGLDTMRMASEGLPFVGKLAQALAGDSFTQAAARRAVGTGLYGAANNQSNPVGGGAEGALLSIAADALPPALRSVGQAAQYIQPQKYADQLMQTLGGGKSLEDNAKSIADDIQNAYQQRIGEGRDLYNSVFDNIPNGSIYDQITGKYPGLSDDISGQYDRDLKDLHSNFQENPTFANAHQLNSQLGSTIRDLTATDQKSGLDMAGRISLQSLQRAQNTLKGDMGSYLNSVSPDLANKYQQATQYWATNVAPYLENSKILPMASGDVENPRNLANIFKNPEEGIQKIVSDLPQDSQNKILYSVLGTPQASATPEALLKNFQKLDSQGLGSYVSPELSDQVDTLSRRISNRDMAQRGASFLLGSSLGHQFDPALAELAGGGLGAWLGPALIKSLQKVLPLDQIATVTKNAAQTAYPGARAALLSNALSGGQ